MRLACARAWTGHGGYLSGRSAGCVAAGPPAQLQRNRRSPAADHQRVRGRGSVSPSDRHRCCTPTAGCGGWPVADASARVALANLQGEAGSMTDAFVLGGVRTPVGRYGGSLSHIRTDDLLGQTMAWACERVGVDLGRIEDIAAGCVNVAHEGMGDIARWAALAAGFPDSVPAATVNRFCASSLTCTIQLAHAIRRAGLAPERIDVWEIHEAYASVALAILRELPGQLDGFKIPDVRLNPNGGAVAIGHPFGSSGTRYVLTLATELRRRQARYGVVGVCVGSGQGVALVLENTSN